jgi:hypothetical protein
MGVLSHLGNLSSSPGADAASRTPAARHVPGRTDAERNQAYACTRTVDQLGAPNNLLTTAQSTELRECRLLLDRLEREGGTPP